MGDLRHPKPPTPTYAYACMWDTAFVNRAETRLEDQEEDFMVRFMRGVDNIDSLQGMVQQHYSNIA